MERTPPSTLVFAPPSGEPPRSGAAPPSRRGCRRLLVGGLLAVTAVGVLLVALLVTVLAVGYGRAGHTNVGSVDLGHALAIPPLLEPRIEPDGTKVFDLRFTAGSTELVPGRTSPTWGLNDSYLGPTLRAERGDRVLVNVTNGVDRPTTLHWHGMHLPAAMDGGPHQMIEPGTTWSPSWTVDQPAASLWYHPHPHGDTADHVYRGAAGMFLIDDAVAASLPLPHRYGLDDVPLIVQDKAVADDGSLVSDQTFLSNAGIVGDQILVNGTWGPMFEARTSLVRFRLLNASNARPYNFGFTDGRTYSVIGSDSGLLPAPHTTDRLVLMPGERAEIVVPVHARDDVVLRSYPMDLGTGFLADRAIGGSDTFDIMRLRAADELETSTPLPSMLVPLDRSDTHPVATTRTFTFSGTSINGRDMDPSRIDAVATVDTAEEWNVRAGDEGYHVFHVHDTRFLVLDVDGRAPPPMLSGWKDTLWLRPGQRFRLLLRFEDHADPSTPYMFHCHVLAHEDRGMMGQLVVTARGQHAGSSSHPDEHGTGQGGG